MKQDGLFGCWIQYIRILVSDSIEKSPRAAFLRPSNRILNLFLKCTSKKKKKTGRRGSGQNNDNVWKAAFGETEQRIQR